MLTQEKYMIEIKLPDGRVGELLNAKSYEDGTLNMVLIMQNLSTMKLDQVAVRAQIQYVDGVRV